MNKKVIVTGASSGIGKGIATRFAKEGYDIGFSYNSAEEEAKALQKELSEKYGVKVYALQASFDQKGAGKVFFDQMVELLGGLDVLVNNAGRTMMEHLLDMTEETLDYLINLDFRNYILMMQYAAQYMVEHGTKGSIVNITSSRGERAYPCDGIYGGVKAGLNRAIQSFALDMAPYGIRINNVAPGSTQVRFPEDKNIRYPQIFDVYKQLGSRIPLERMGTPADMANAVYFLAGDEASYITGITLRVDGGLILAGMPERLSDDNPEYKWGYFRRDGNH